MMLPIDFRNRPFKPKYIDEETRETSHWFIFGEHPDDGTVDIMDGTQNDVIVHVPADKAERICEARNRFVDALLLEVNG